ncbi:acetylcholine receptor subunit alpha-like 1 isoform X2 [Paramacrobiotus metropolitanus]|uniref:acetylcholine receptor subunit alpha-like 1 isoform X2 n=1 Tax=Paramacrobiotus metropolitanus TaxID=2943436 RepID=UPI0024457AC8|nr:acetylcholine receptor subunit alpha-like 1 isoform X2 [Paramacrobiotus metropolitanus]
MPQFATVLQFLFISTVAHNIYSNSDAEKLYIDLMRDYNKLIRPVVHNTEILNVSMGLKFTQLIDVDEVNQVITTNVVVRQTWNDFKLVWNPKNYGGIENIYIPSESLWLPDLVLYNNADGNYQITMMTKVTVRYTGDVIWDPPAIYKSYCRIDVQYFPYDKQSCDMKYGSWTYDGLSVNLLPIRGYEQDDKRIEIGMDLSEYKPSVEWDILEAFASRHTLFYACCREPYLDITFTLVIRRKTLFYTINLISPCVAISFLTVFVFYLPSDSGEKVTLCISILLSLTVFFLLLSEIIPPTSFTVPLIGKYLLFTMFRNPSTHRMRPWVRRIFLQLLPKLLGIQRPSDKDRARSLTKKKGNTRLHEYERVERQPLCGYQSRGGPSAHAVPRPDTLLISGLAQRRLGYDLQNVIDGINYIVDHVKETTESNHTVQDWKYFALVLDRLCLWIFSLVCIAGTAAIILNAPPLYETQQPIPQPCLSHVIPGSLESWQCLFANSEEEE